MTKATYLPETEELLSQVKAKGLNVWAMLAIFKKRSGLVHKIPDPVIQAVCKEYLKMYLYSMGGQGKIRQDFPYFLEILKRKSSEHFAKESMAEGEWWKKQPLAIGDIMKVLAQGGK